MASVSAKRTRTTAGPRAIASLGPGDEAPVAGAVGVASRASWRALSPVGLALPRDASAVAAAGAPWRASWCALSPVGLALPRDEASAAAAAGVRSRVSRRALLP